MILSSYKKLAVSVGLLGSLAAVCVATVADEDHIWDVLIIGGGWAGLGAAQHLIEEERLSNIAILEARGRTGGRSYTDFGGLGKHGLVTEIGSAWVYPGTSVAKLVDEIGLNSATTQFLFDTFGLYDSKGVLSPEDRTTLLDNEFRKNFIPFATKQAKDDVDVESIKTDYFTEEDQAQLYQSELSEERQTINAMVNAGKIDIRTTYITKHGNV